MFGTAGSGTKLRSLGSHVLLSHGRWFIIDCQTIPSVLEGSVSPRADLTSHADTTGSTGTIPRHLQRRGSFLVSVRGSQPCPGILAEFQERHYQRRPHWALCPKEEGDPLVPDDVYRGQQFIKIPKQQAWAKQANKKVEQPRAAAA